MRSKSKMSLKKEIVGIIDNAEFLGNRKIAGSQYDKRKQISQTNMYVTEVIDEHGCKRIYHFNGNYKDVLLQRAASINRATSYKFKDRENGTSTQKIMLFLKEHKEALQALYDINYLMTAHKYNAQEACRVLFKDKKQLPPNIRIEGTNGFYKPTIYRFYTDSYFRSTRIEYLIDYILPILPKAYFNGLEGYGA